MILLNEWRKTDKCESAIKEILQTGKINSGGHYSLMSEKYLKNYFPNSAEIILTSSCTSALEVAALAINLSPDDEVIVPSYTFPSTINAFAQYGVKIKFADVNGATANITLKSITDLLTKKTKAVIVVHYAGAASELIEIQKLCKDKKITLIEDNAHGFMGKYAGVPLGSFGDFSAISFHHTKNIGCGEGGALICNKSASYRCIKDNGTNRKDFMDRKVSFYDWQTIGTNAAMTEISAALLFFQLKNSEKIQYARHQAWSFYLKELNEWAIENHVSLPKHDPLSSHSAHIFHLIFPSKDSALGYIKHMEDNNIQCLTHFKALHLSPAGIKLGGEKFICDNTKFISERLVRLPLHPYLSDEDLRKVTSTTKYYQT